MAKAIVGGEEIEVSFPNFKALKEFWPYQKKIQTSAGDIEIVTEGILGMISAGGAPKYTLDELEDRLKPTEIIALGPFLTVLTVELGLRAPPGEGAPAGEKGAKPSTETLTASSPSLSSQDAEDGTK